MTSCVSSVFSFVKRKPQTRAEFPNQQHQYHLEHVRIHVLRPHRRPNESEAGRVGPSKLCFTKPSRWKERDPCFIKSQPKAQQNAHKLGSANLGRESNKNISRCSLKETIKVFISSNNGSNSLKKYRTLGLAYSLNPEHDDSIYFPAPCFPGSGLRQLLGACITLCFATKPQTSSGWVT